MPFDAAPMAPPARHARFTWALVQQLAALAPPPPAAATRPSRADRPAGDELGRRVRAYLDRVPVAVSGQRGHDRTFYAAGRLVRGFDLSVDQALPFFREWNARCQPPWDDRELERKLLEAARQPGPRGFLLDAPPPTDRPDPSGPRFTNFYWADKADGSTTRRAKFGLPAARILDDLRNHTGGWPRVCGVLPFARRDDGEVEWLDSPAKLSAWAAAQYAGPGQSGTDWDGGVGLLSKQEFYEHVVQAGERWEAVEPYPHEPPLPHAFYLHPPVGPGDGTALAELVAKLHPATPHDEELLRAFLLTTLWGGHCGSRPLFVFEADDADGKRGRGAGKTTAVKVAGWLLGGAVGLDPNDQLRDWQVRLLSPSARTVRLALMDNVKSLKLSMASLEAFITADTISGRQLHVGEGRRPNSLTWCMTFNAPSLGKDLAQRAVIVRVKRPTYGPAWEAEVRRLVQADRWRVIADIVAELRRPSCLPADFQFTRWSAWERDVLGKLADPAGLQRLIAERAQAVDDDDEQAAEVADALRDLIRDQFGIGTDPDAVACMIPVGVLAEKIVKRFAPDIRTPHHATKWLYMLHIPELTKSKDNKNRGGVWVGRTCPDPSRLRRWEIPP